MKVGGEGDKQPVFFEFFHNIRPSLDINPDILPNKPKLKLFPLLVTYFAIIENIFCVLPTKISYLGCPQLREQSLGDNLFAVLIKLKNRTGGTHKATKGALNNR